MYPVLTPRRRLRTVRGQGTIHRSSTVIFDSCRRCGRTSAVLDPASCLLGLTMKFGKDLEQYKHPEWEDEYMNYQMLKDILRKLESQAKVSLDCDCPT